VREIVRGAVSSPRYNVYDFAEAMRIRFISTNLENKETNIG